jgi:hypothetical protein
VLYQDDESFTFMMPEGHGFARLITFSAFRRDDITMAQLQLLVPATNPLVELGLMFGAHQYENVCWQRTLIALLAHSASTATSAPAALRMQHQQLLNQPGSTSSGSCSLRS